MSLFHTLQFFLPKNLFNVRPNPISIFTIKIMVSFFVLMILSAIIFRWYYKKNISNNFIRKVYLKFYYTFLTVALLGLLYSFFGFEAVPFFSMRLWLLILTIIFLIWMFFNLKYTFIIVPKIKKELQQKREFRKYLP